MPSDLPLIFGTVVTNETQTPLRGANVQARYRIRDAEFQGSADLPDVTPREQDWPGQPRGSVGSFRQELQHAFHGFEPTSALRFHVPRLEVAEDNDEQRNP